MPRPSSPHGSTARHARRRQAQPPLMEGLEPRLLLSGDLPSISKIEADNRGLVVMTATRDLDPTTITTASFRATTAGADLLFNTGDDTAAAISGPTYDAATRTIRFTVNVSANQRYKVTLDSSIIKGANGVALDGEFHSATSISGDAVAGGDLVFYTKKPASEVARITTFAGSIDVDLLRSRAPITVANYLRYADEGAYDNTFFHRNAVSGGNKFVVQGGGFQATTGFPTIPTHAAIQNEFGVSNTRGTIAMAKLGSNPNSATDQFFFNLGDNSANLDNQNGGFTVFARVKNNEGLAVMDALSNFQNFNASSQNGAFDTLPVRDLPTVQARGSVTPGDLITVSRVALLVDLSAQPTGQLNLAGQQVFSSGTVTVTVSDLGGTGLGGTDFIDVRFGTGNVVRSINIKSGFTGVAGITITGASRVDSITDSRRDLSGDIGFIASQDAPIGSISLKTSITGFDINGVTLSPGFGAAADVDGDGKTDDPTAILVTGSGPTASIKIAGDLGGSIILPGALASLDVGGTTTNADIKTGGQDTDRLTLKFHSVKVSSLSTPMGIDSLTATEWINDNQPTTTVAALNIRRMQITGDRALGITGHFEPKLSLTGTSQANTVPALNNVRVAGGVFNTWAITGSVGTINILGEPAGWTMTVTGDAADISVRRTSGSSITVNGNVKRFTAADWQGGGFTAGTIDLFRTVKDRSIEANGDFRGNLTVNTTTGVALKRVSMAGGFQQSNLDIKGPADNVVVNGASSGTAFTFRATVNKLTTGDLVQSNVNVNTTAQNIKVKSWDGGVVSGGNFNRITVTGNARFNINNTSSVLHTVIGGNWETTTTTRGGFDIRVAGDLTNSKISLTETNVLESIRSLIVGKSMINSEFRAVRNVPTISLGRMENAGVYVGAPTNQVGLPANAANTNDSVKINSFTVTGAGSGKAFVNSFLVTGRLGTVSLARVQTDNAGTVHGIAANRIASIKLTGNPNASFSNPGQTISRFGDFRIQLNPAATS